MHSPVLQNKSSTITANFCFYLTASVFQSTLLSRRSVKVGPVPPNSHMMGADHGMIILNFNEYTADCWTVMGFTGIFCNTARNKQDDVTFTLVHAMG